MKKTKKTVKPLQKPKTLQEKLTLNRQYFVNPDGSVSLSFGEHLLYDKPRQR
jgi:hypothetical protein